MGCLNMMDEDGSGMSASSSSVTSAVVPFSATVLRVDASCVLHPIFVGCGAYSAHDNCPCICLGVGRPGSVPFVSDRPGAYGRLLMAVYMRWQTGLLVSSDLLRPVMRGGWRAGFLEPVRGSVDVS